MQSEETIKIAVEAYERGIEEAQKTVDALTKELEKVRASCPHEETFDEERVWAPMRFVAGKTCKVCGHWEADKPTFESIVRGNINADID